ncbi:hypothetical protein D3C72_2405200 [compost metagenome]
MYCTDSEAVYPHLPKCLPDQTSLFAKGSDDANCQFQHLIIVLIGPLGVFLASIVEDMVSLCIEPLGDMVCLSWITTTAAIRA